MVWWVGGGGGGGKRVCIKCELALARASGTCSGGKGRLKVNSHDGTGRGAPGWPSFGDDHGWGGWLAGDGGGNRGANEELAPGTPGPERCPTGLPPVPVTDEPMASSREEVS